MLLTWIYTFLGERFEESTFSFVVLVAESATRESFGLAIFAKNIRVWKGLRSLILI